MIRLQNKLERGNYFQPRILRASKWHRQDELDLKASVTVNPLGWLSDNDISQKFQN
jgi:hypothetical protein